MKKLSGTSDNAKILIATFLLSLILIGAFVYIFAKKILLKNYLKKILKTA